MQADCNVCQLQCPRSPQEGTIPNTWTFQLHYISHNHNPLLHSPVSCDLLHLLSFYAWFTHCEVLLVVSLHFSAFLCW